MADPVGITIGVVGLAGLFSSAVDCFEYVQLGRNFGKNFGTSLLKLDNARLRLTRWGIAVGVSGDLKDVQSLRLTSVSAQDIQKTERILGQILELFADAEGISAKFKSRAEPGDASLVVYNAQTELEPVMASLHQKMRELSIKRQNRTGLLKKTKWALYEEKHFRRLVEDVTELVNDLVELFPAAQAPQRELCEMEVLELATDESLPVLKDICVDQDKYLEAAIIKAIGNRKRSSPTVIFSGSNNSGLQVGYNEGTIANTRWGGAA